MRQAARGRPLALALLSAALIGAPAAAVADEQTPVASADEQTPVASADEQAPVAWWRFERPGQEQVFDTSGQIGDSISGNFTRVDGVAGSALRLDGFTTVITRDAALAPRLEGGFTFDAWVAVAAYPWNWCPILAQRGDHEGAQGSAEQEDERESAPREGGPGSGYLFGVGPQGHVGLHLSVGGEWRTFVSSESLPLRSWTHVAAVYREGAPAAPREAARVLLYINGELSAEFEVSGPVDMAPDEDLLIGSNREKVTPSHPVPPGAGTLPSWFSLDGILDEVRVFDRALSPEQIRAAARVDGPLPAADIPPRVMPSGPPGPGRFGAYYAHLKYYEEWDALWRVADHPDVVVQFDGSPVRVVFWRGLRYSPAWVTENGLWLADQSAESGNHEGCVEHMQDIHTLYSHVRIIESSPARAVVHWRYAPVSAHGNLWIAEERTERAWWVDEYYTFYPDGTGVRKVRWRQPEPGSEFPWLQIQETSVLAHPGQNAVDLLEPGALTLVNLEGESQTYSWPDDDSVNTRDRRTMAVDPSIVRDLKPDDPVIQVVNMRSEARPFVILEPENRPRVYVGRVRDRLVDFPAYNHWPVCQVRSDGRFAQAADRASSFSISQNFSRHHVEEDGVEWVTMLYGATFGEAVDLVPLARSWIHPPELRIIGEAAESRGYDLSQRAYLLTSPPDAEWGDVSLEISADSASPLVNALLLLEDWGDVGVEVSIDGQRADPGTDFRPAYRSTLRGTDLLIWLQRTSTDPLTIEVTRAPQGDSARALN